MYLIYYSVNMYSNIFIAKSDIINYNNHVFYYKIGVAIVCLRRFKYYAGPGCALFAQTKNICWKPEVHKNGLVVTHRRVTSKKLDPQPLRLYLLKPDSEARFHWLQVETSAHTDIVVVLMSDRGVYTWSDRCSGWGTSEYGFMGSPYTSKTPIASQVY